jgi:hypothetical protein
MEGAEGERSASCLQPALPPGNAVLVSTRPGGRQGHSGNFDKRTRQTMYV